MPNPPASGAAPPPLRKFTLHPPSLTAVNSPVTLAANGSGPMSPTSLVAVRSSLVSARSQAAERLAIRDGNRRNLTERQANEKRVAEEQARLKDAERRRKREEDERREKERVEKAEKERIEREREEAAARKREEEAYQKQKAKEEEEMRIKDELEKQAVLQRAREATEKKRQDEANAAAAAAAASVKAASKSKAPKAATPQPPSDGTQDVKMEDAPSVTHSESQPAEADTAPSSAPTFNVASSPEPEEDVGQPKPPTRHDKKKRKRDNVIDSDGSDSEDQPLLLKARKMDSQSATAGPTPSPTPQPNGTLSASGLPRMADVTEVDDDPNAGLSLIERKLKEEKFVKHSIPIRPPAPGTATAFYLPSQSLVPPKPATQPAAPTPKRQADVRGDFSVAKPGTQIAYHTFHTWADAYLRPFGEDDLAFLAPKPDDVSPYIIPTLGKHYSERWEEEDAGMPIASTSAYASPLEPPPLTRTRPAHLNEDTLGSEVVSLGPLSERLVSALAFTEPGIEDDDANGTSKMDSRDEQTAQSTMQLDAVDLEERIKRELRFIGVLPEDDVDWSTREDDEISSALRACQRELHHQTALNEARKNILTSIVKDRMAYQDFETTRDAQERIIEAGWNKRQRAGKKKTKGKERETRSESGKSAINMALLEAMTKRNRLVSHFRPFFEDEEDQGRFQGIPETSIYEGLEELLNAEEEEEGIGL